VLDSLRNRVNRYLCDRYGHSPQTSTYSSGRDYVSVTRCVRCRDLLSSDSHTLSGPLHRDVRVGNLTTVNYGDGWRSVFRELRALWRTRHLRADYLRERDRFIREHGIGNAQLLDDANRHLDEQLLHGRPAAQPAPKDHAS
jgi:hypothetical protein